MREREISATEFKAKCLGILDEVSTGASIVITKRGKPIARLTRASHQRRPLMGGMAGTSDEVGDIVHFDSTELWRSAR
ncbi:MAG: type II toxin-antitoxin system prevent-host-death family antitoxin [Bryobacterales bacterium]|nr:type II toxin-antitoxin system prevent-host-death family antitoxin [Bryobacterales bacterium]MBV9396876.1 type II toxin-antitoxin system prevent-host-death family antitoxin [Bryobacterales bacterium]MBV9686738.1 type II toxin-antitoxin system prevent-host-death family antitoxin [Alphaproteobacteria bacterium]